MPVSGTIDRLSKIGFEKAGYWALNDDQLELVLENFKDRKNILYVFVVNSDVKYIGKTTMPLAKRLYGYLKPGPTQSTNIKNNQNILSALSGGSSVEILALPDSGLHQIGEFHLNLAAGLEDDLIATLRPEWNGAQRVREAAAVTASPRRNAQTSEFPKPTKGKSSDSGPVHTFHVRPTYMKQGFFNVPVLATNFYGGDKDKIEVYCGKAKLRIDGHINRSVNTNNTPRIMGGVSLRDWFQKNFEENDVAEVTVLTPNRIHIANPRAKG